MNTGFPHPSFSSMPAFMGPSQSYKQAPLPNANALTLYIGDLEEQISEEFLYPYFSKFGPIYSLKIMRDRFLRKSRGFGFITYYNMKDVELAKANANHDIILSRPIRVTNYRSPKEASVNANVFLKDLDKSIKIQDVDKALGKYGRIFSSKISTDENGESRGYGYVQFETEKEAEECLLQVANAPIVVNDKPLNVERYLPKSGRPNNAIQNNLYVKNLPKNADGKSEEQHLKDLEKELRERFSQGGKRPIGSFILKTDGNGRFFSFICFESNADAESALNDFNSKEFIIDGSSSNEPLYVNWAEKKALRIKNLKERKQSRSNETNLYTKGLKKTVLREELEKVFSQFGKITSCIITESPDARIDTKQGFINFESKDDARTAFIQAKDKPDIRNLYANESVYINWFLKKEFNKKVKELRYKGPNMPFMPMGPMGMEMGAPFMMPFMQPHFPPQFRSDYMGGYPGGGYPGGGRPGGRQFELGGPPSQRVPGGFPGAGQHRPYPRQGGPPMSQNRGQKPPYNNYRGGQPSRPYQSGNRGPPKTGGPMGMVPGMVTQGQGEKPANQPAIIQPAPTSLRDNMTEFLKLDKNKQREQLGNMLFPRIKKYADDELAPKITGMLIDFSVFEVQDIVEFLENEESLKEKIMEAKDLIESQAA